MTFGRPISPWIYSLVVALLVANTCQAQLTLLSEGNTSLQWRDAQISTMKGQLGGSNLDPQLQRELEARVKWLSQWTPDQLGKEPTGKSPVKEMMTEPSLDPNRRASALRRRLFGPKAKPTSRDTKALEKLLADYPADIGVRQLHLHWLDQRQYRKTYPDEIAEAAQRLIGLLDQVKPVTKDLQVAKAFCYYRRGRALAYRELPEVVAKKPIEDPKLHEAKLQGAYNQLRKIVGLGRPEFILLDIRMLRRDGWLGQALDLLETHGELIDPQWYLKKRRDILRELAWEAPADEAADIYQAEFPKQVAEESKLTDSGS